MHLITGMIIAALAGRTKNKKDLQKIPYQNTGPLRIAHVLPGRVRFIVPDLRELDERVLAGIDQLQNLKEIDQVTVNVISGSVLINFNEEKLDPVLLFSVVARLMGLEKQLEERSHPLLLEELNAFGNSLNRAVYDETFGLIDLRTVAIAALLMIGGRQVLREKWASIPSGVTLVWWAFNLLNRKNGAG